MTTGDSAADAIAHPGTAGLELARRPRHGISSPPVSPAREIRTALLDSQAMSCLLYPTTLPSGEPAALVDQPRDIAETGQAADPVSLRLCWLGGRSGYCGRGGYWLRGAGEVGAPDPDHGEVDDQGEQRDPGGDQEPAAEPGGQAVVVDGCGQWAAGAGRVPGAGGGGGLGVDGVGGDGPGDGAEQRQADGAADLLTGVEQAGGDAGVGFGDAVQRDQGQRDEQQRGPGADDQGRAEHRGGVGVVLADPRQPVQAAGGGRRAGQQQRAGADPGHELGNGAGGDQEGGGE